MKYRELSTNDRSYLIVDGGIKSIHSVNTARVEIAALPAVARNDIYGIGVKSRQWTIRKSKEIKKIDSLLIHVVQCRDLTPSFTLVDVLQI